MKGFGPEVQDVRQAFRVGNRERSLRHNRTGVSQLKLPLPSFASVQDLGRDGEGSRDGAWLGHIKIWIVPSRSVQEKPKIPRPRPLNRNRDRSLLIDPEICPCRQSVGLHGELVRLCPGVRIGGKYGQAHGQHAK